MSSRNFLGEPKSNIILALDVSRKEECYLVLDQCYDLIDAVKFNYPLILNEGISIISKIKSKYNLPILVDFKVADVPTTNNKILQIVKGEGADAILVHGFIGIDAIDEMQTIANGQIGIMIATELTHPGGLDFTAQHAADFARICLGLDCYGIQAPGTRPEKVRKLRCILGEEKVIVSCGVGRQGGDFSNVLSAGANFAIIGRSIYESNNHRDQVINFINEKNTNSNCT